MNGKEFWIMLLRQLFICYTLTMLATLISAGWLSNPPVQKLSLAFLWQMAGFSVLAASVSLVYYSPEPLSRAQWKHRDLLHTLLLLLALCLLGHLLDLYRGLGGLVFFVLLILAVDALVRFFIYLFDRQTAGKINRALQEKRKQNHDLS